MAYNSNAGRRSTFNLAIAKDANIINLTSNSGIFEDICASTGVFVDICATTISGVSFIGTGNSIIHGDISVNGTGRFTNLIVNEDLIVHRDTFVLDDTFIVDDTTISGSLTVISDLTVSGPISTSRLNTTDLSATTISADYIYSSSLTISGPITTPSINTTHLSATSISGDRLDVSGSSRFRNDNMIIDNYLTVGKTSTPTFPLDISGSIRILRTLNAGKIVFGTTELSGSIIQTGTTGELYLDTGADSIRKEILFRPGGTEAIRIDSNGFVGIGTISPSYKLDISGTFRTSLQNGNNLIYTQNISDNNLIFEDITHNKRLKILQNTTANYIQSSPYTNDTSFIPILFTTVSNDNAYLKLYDGGTDICGILKIGNLSNKGSSIMIGHNNINYPGSHTFGTGLYLYTDDSKNGFIRTQGSGAKLCLGTQNVNQMTIIPSGFIGIGTDTPQFPLHITSINSTSLISSTRYFNTLTLSGVAPEISGFISVGVSIKGQDYIWATSGFVASSDRRIKTDISDLVDNECLSIIRKLKPKKYSYVDKLQRGSLPVYGFIAQDIASDISYATGIQKELIPDYYGIVSPFFADASSIQVILDKDYTISADTPLQCIVSYRSVSDSSGDEDVYIASKIDSTCLDYDSSTRHLSFTHNLPISSVDDISAVFFYGKQVDDFHTLNKDAIWTIATAAIQEIDRIQQHHQEELTKLRNRPTIFRGSVSLSGSSPTTSVHLDSHLSLAPEEFSTKLNPQVFLQNRSGWSQVRGSIIGDSLTIETNTPSSTDVIDFMIVADE